MGYLWQTDELICYDVINLEQFRQPAKKGVKI
jgi:hypothetical protein